ncbi:MAG: site-specific integrase, partial [Acidaminococcaceae bacterium]|nr:site-specific integrase [Acidaminococcaceae bacterium]
MKILLGKPDLKKVTFNEYKIWALSNYLLATGNRISSALFIKIKDLEFDNLTIQINHSKNRRAQIIPMSPFLATILKEYLIHRKGSPNDYVFCNSYGEQGNIHTYQTMIYKHNRSKGIDKTSAHLYRHTFAKRWILNGGDIF